MAGAKIPTKWEIFTFDIRVRADYKSHSLASGELMTISRRRRTCGAILLNLLSRVVACGSGI
jgi:hypothetical protein